MLYTEDFTMRHYVRFSQIGSQMYGSGLINKLAMTSGITWIFSPFPFPVHAVVTISMINVTKLNVVHRKWEREWKTETETYKFIRLFTSEVHRIRYISVATSTPS